jgi:hypothetical protein
MRWECFVLILCDRLAPLGWHSLLLEVTGGQLDILRPTNAVRKAGLTKMLTAIDRTVTGFTDFSLSGAKAITSGSPANSVYHAPASPKVTVGISEFPTLKEIETVKDLCSAFSRRREMGKGHEGRSWFRRVGISSDASSA